jgi:hypothetical protein
MRNPIFSSASSNLLMIHLLFKKSEAPKKSLDARLTLKKGASKRTPAGGANKPELKIKMLYPRYQSIRVKKLSLKVTFKIA